MGQKVNPTGIRLLINKTWESKWYVDGKAYAEFLKADLRARQFLKKELYDASVSRVQIERPAKKTAVVKVYSARPGIIIKRNGGIDALREKTSKILGVPTHLTIEEIRKPELEAELVAQVIAQQLENRVMFRRAMKRAVTNAMKLGAVGIKVSVSGRLGGAEIARREWYKEGRVPLHTFRVDIDYGTAEAKTTYGIIGVKVWICKKDSNKTSATKSTA